MSTYLEHGVLCDRTGLALATFPSEPEEFIWRSFLCGIEEPHEHHLVMRVVTLGDWSEPLATEATS